MRAFGATLVTLCALVACSGKIREADPQERKAPEIAKPAYISVTDLPLRDAHYLAEAVSPMATSDGTFGVPELRYRVGDYQLTSWRRSADGESYGFGDIRALLGDYAIHCDVEDVFGPIPCFEGDLTFPEFFLDKCQEPVAWGVSGHDMFYMKWGVLRACVPLDTSRRSKAQVDMIYFPALPENTPGCERVGDSSMCTHSFVTYD